MQIKSLISLPFSLWYRYLASSRQKRELQICKHNFIKKTNANTSASSPRVHHQLPRIHPHEGHVSDSMIYSPAIHKVAELCISWTTVHHGTSNPIQFVDVRNQPIDLSAIWGINWVAGTHATSSKGPLTCHVEQHAWHASQTTEAAGADQGTDRGGDARSSFCLGSTFWLIDSKWSSPYVN